MIDFHSHILYGLDDGIQSFEDSVAVIKEAKEAGFDKIICTTHCSHYFSSTERKRKAIIKELSKEKLGVDLILGNEIYARSGVLELLSKKDASTINNSKYILFEFPMHDEYPEYKNFIINLMSKGYKLVLAHPERYDFFQKNPKLLEELIDLGVYFQANYLSIEGFYGSSAKNLVELLFKHNMISFLGTDVHDTKRFYPSVKKACKKIISLIGEDKFNELSDTNIKYVLENEEFESYDYTPLKNNFLGKYK